MKKTYHAEIRMQQRGLTDPILEIIMHNGHQEDAPGGALKIFFGNREFSQEMEKLKKYQKLLEKAKNRVVVVKDDIMLTTYKNQRQNILAL